MSTYVTVVQKWLTELTPIEISQIGDYIKTQTAGNGDEITYKGMFARSWVDQQAAADFCDFVKTIRAGVDSAKTTIITVPAV